MRCANVFFCVLILLQISMDVCASEITEAMKADDPRLSVNVGLRTEKITVKSLLNQLSSQTKVSITTNEQDFVAGQTLLVNFKDQPLWQALDALLSVLETTDGKYYWNRVGRRGAYEYQLYETTAARHRSSRLRQYVLEADERYIDTMCELAQMTPERRIRERDRLVRAMLGVDTPRLNSLFADAAQWDGPALVAAATNRQDRHEMLVNAQGRTFPVAGLNDEARDALKRWWIAGNRRDVQSDGSFVPVPLPTTISLAGHNFGNSAPAIAFREPDSATSLISPLFFNEALAEVIRSRWMGPTDARVDELELRSAVETPPLVKSDADWPLPDHIDTPPGMSQEEARRIIVEMRARPNKALGTAQQLLLMTDQCRVPVIAAIADGHGWDRFQKGMPLGEFLRKLDRAQNIGLHKWHNGWLLCTFVSWFLGEEGVYPYAVMKPLLESKDGMVEMKPLIAMVSHIAESDMSTLGQKYPVFAGAAAIYLLLRQAGAQPALISAQGLGLDDAERELVQRVPIIAGRPPIQDGTAERIRLAQYVTKDGAVRQIAIRVECLVNGEWKPLTAMIQRAPAR